jgi:carbon monoxide dehydrogenase subunit G
MRLEHQFTVPVPVEEAWAVLNDLERVVPSFPGAALTSFDGDNFAGTCKVKLGPVSLQYTGTGLFVERDPAAHRAVIEAKGKDRRGSGTATAKVTAQLTAAGESSTAATVETDLTVTGKPAQFGRGLMQDVSDKLLGQFVDNLTKELGTTAPTEPAAPTVEGPEPVRSAPAAPPEGEPAGEATLNLGSTVVPVLARRLSPYLIGALLALIIRRLLRR